MTDEIPDTSTTPSVRPKASHRKGRTPETSRTPRVPTQERSKARYLAIIKAAEELLERSNIEDLSLYDIAKQSGIAPASVHYLFSTITAVHLELHRLHNDKLTERVIESSAPLIAQRNPSWQEWIYASMKEARDALNSSRPMSEVMLGPTMHRQTRLTNLKTNFSLGQKAVEYMHAVFIMPDIPHLDRYYGYAAEFSDALWSGAYSAHGRIDDETFAESVRATVAYLRCFLPETLHLRTSKPQPPFEA
ncbi:TetR/AcrR family transcriptional regulator [Variovorax sp. 22077]|uniref:TetR/AcrR family transcriptional regulator n=1 Tax=Variovorax sp. 22077 TaxID=3453867 RepID=UPI003F82E559